MGMKIKTSSEPKIHTAPWNAEIGPGDSHYPQIFTNTVYQAYGKLPCMMIGLVACAVVVGLLLHDIVPHARLAYWLGAVILCSSVAPAPLFYLFRKQQPEYPGIKKWGVAFAVYGLLTGASWGAAGYIFFSADSLEYQLLLFFILMLSSAGATAAMVIYQPAFYAAVLPLLLPIIIRSAQVGELIPAALSAGAAVYGAMLIFFYRATRKAYLDSLLLQYQNLELVQQKSRFIAAASHDLRQPLHAQGLFVSELMERIEDPACKDIVRKLEGSLKSVNELLNAMLDVSRLDAGIIELRVEHFFIQNILDDLESELQPPMRKKNLLFRVSPCSAVVRSDTVLLARMLRNLLTNALHFTEKGFVLLACQEHGDELTIEVRDTGLGIPEMERQAIFQEFYQIDNPQRRREKGLGLGLSIVQRLAKLLKHRLELKSEPGRGSLFVISVPIGEKALVHPKIVAEYPVGVTSKLRDCRVLLIEDDQAVKEAMSARLTSWGCKVLAAESGVQALQLLADLECAPQAIISDYRLGAGTNGVDVIKRIRAQSGVDIPALIISGDTASECIREAVSSGIVLLHKPVASSELRNTLETVMNMYAVTTAECSALP